MKLTETYRIPTIEVESREDLLRLLLYNPPECVFEQVEEKLNPVGLQWNYTLSAKLESEDIGVAIIRYKESLYEQPDTSKCTIATWLAEEIPAIKNWYRGILKP